MLSAAMAWVSGNRGSLDHGINAACSLSLGDEGGQALLLPHAPCPSPLPSRLHSKAAGT
jgi:hypothetical protein